MYLSAINPSITVDIPPGAAGIAYTLEVMANMVNDEKRSPQLRGVAAHLVEHLLSKDFTGEVLAVHQYVRDSIRYLRDVHDDETVQTPTQTLFMQAGDCDDQATLVATLLNTIGIPARFVAIGFLPDTFQHVYAEAYIDGIGWQSVETTENVAVGWQPEGVQARMVQSI